MNLNSRHLLPACLLILSLIWTESNKSNLVLWFLSPAFPENVERCKTEVLRQVDGKWLQNKGKLKCNTSSQNSSWNAAEYHSDLLCVRVYECEFSFKSEQLSRDCCSPYVCGINVSSWLAAVLKDHNKINEALSYVSAKQKVCYVWIL